MRLRKKLRRYRQSKMLREEQLRQKKLPQRLRHKQLKGQEKLLRLLLKLSAKLKRLKERQRQEPMKLISRQDWLQKLRQEQKRTHLKELELQTLLTAE